MKKVLIITFCFFLFKINAQDVSGLKLETENSLKNFYASLENMIDSDLKMSERRKFIERVLRGQCDKSRTIFYNNLKTVGSLNYKVGAYLDNVISFFPYGGKIDLQIEKIYGPVFTERMDKVYFIPEVKSTFLDYRNEIPYTTHLLYYIGFEPLGEGTYSAGIILSSEPWSEERVEDIISQKIIIINEIIEDISIVEKYDILLESSNFRFCKGGQFTMGNPKESADCDQDEKPETTVFINAFRIQEHEVTNDQYLEFLKIYDSDKVKSGDYKGQLMIYPSSNGLQKVNGSWTCGRRDRNKPVVDVTWYGAITFANFYGLDLPTEAQWEYAARSGNNTDTFHFAGSDSLYQLGFYGANSTYETKSVMRKIPNNLNLFDMSGNVWEWCKNWYRKNAYSNYSKIRFVEKGSMKSVRGGGFASNEWDCRTQNRWYKEPELHTNDIGFRCVKNY